MKPLFPSLLITTPSPLSGMCPLDTPRGRGLLVNLLAHGILQSAWQPWQQHHGLGLAPQAFQMPCHGPQSAIPDWPLGRPSKLPTGRRISLRLSSLVFLHLCSHSDICFNLATPWICPRILP